DNLPPSGKPITRSKSHPFVGLWLKLRNSNLNHDVMAIEKRARLETQNIVAPERCSSNICDPLNT
ncbi:MAG TPA: hypothetical protein VIT23_14250, partial [Terrimicrobiaceae bacterium]